MPLSEERMIRIQIEEMRDSNRTPDADDEERTFRRNVARDIEKIPSSRSARSSELQHNMIARELGL